MYVENYTDNWKNIVKSLHFAEVGHDRGSEDIKKECNLKLKRSALKYKNKVQMHTGKDLEVQ